MLRAFHELGLGFRVGFRTWRSSGLNTSICLRADAGVNLG